MPFPRKIESRAAALAAILGLLACLASCTVVKHGDASAKADGSADGTFDAKAYVAANWDSKIIPEVAGNAKELREVVSALRKDRAAAERKYGLRKEETAPFDFMVKSVAVVKSINTESAAGYVELDVDDASGEGKVKLQIGPVIKSSAVRDVLSFIKFGDFVNQLDFANISREINFRVRDSVVADIRKGDPTGRRLSFAGAFAEDESGAVLITPVEIGFAK
jgi:predicted lipoprotein